MVEKELLVFDIKGLLKGLEDVSRDARWQLAFYNIDDLKDKTSMMKAIIDRIENLIPLAEEDNGDEFI